MLALKDKLGKTKLTDAELMQATKVALWAVDEDGDGVLSFPEFCAFFGIPMIDEIFVPVPVVAPVVVEAYASWVGVVGHFFFLVGYCVDAEHTVYLTKLAHVVAQTSAAATQKGQKLGRVGMRVGIRHRTAVGAGGGGGGCRRVRIVHRRGNCQNVDRRHRQAGLFQSSTG